ncbi:MAG: hypothetical protein CVV15_12740 [Gammaproteobacteria bacterium HGW-Gammaproteobacteria-5]|nr:MAG: hypothetical protein CVV15_12740 [Gammaproteobacteria bacterium HGW-Gammaproteobacteria-5]PKM14385.1 MAG: hypothetical protein CVV12_14295 [Gammaproteobacteria bacterium HGW-Gammaproteobacteria-2]
MDKRLLDILCCPLTRQPLLPLSAEARDIINRAIAAGTIKRGDGSVQEQPLRAALRTRDGKLVYRIADGIPVLLSDESISTAQVTDLPA